MTDCTSCTCLPFSLSMTALTWAASTGLPVALRIAVKDSSSELWRIKYLAPCPRVWRECRLRDTACFVVQIIYIIILIYILVILSISVKFSNHCFLCSPSPSIISSRLLNGSSSLKVPPTNGCRKASSADILCSGLNTNIFLIRSMKSS